MLALFACLLNLAQKRRRVKHADARKPRRENFIFHEVEKVFVPAGEVIGVGCNREVDVRLILRVARIIEDARHIVERQRRCARFPR